MTIFTYSEARQKLSTILNTATRDGEVLIRRQDGRVYSLRPQKQTESPFDVEGITTKISTKEIADFVRESRAGAGGAGRVGVFFTGNWNSSNFLGAF